MWTSVRILSVAGLAFSAAFVVPPRPAAAAYYYPWCARYYDRSSETSCAFPSKEMCMASVSGRGGYCIENVAGPPFAAITAYGSSRHAPTARHRVHRHHH
jgi:hypothetical protein